MINRNELKKKYGDEQVFVIPVSLVNGIPDKFTYQTAKKEEIKGRYGTQGKYIPRYLAEYDESLQQIIPYFAICNKDQSKFFVAKRIAGESRLVDKLSLGFGGHINECDGYTSHIFNCINREMDEELNVNTNKEIKFIGTIRDITSPTNDHFGLAFKVVIEDENKVSIKETDKMIGEWMTKQQLFDNYGKFEGWSKYIIDYLYELC